MMSPTPIAFLSCKSLDGYVVDDQLAVDALLAAGFSVDTIPWDAPAEWSKYGAVIVRTTWDYTQRLDEFLKTLKTISSQTLLINDFETICWNAKKTYLRDLAHWDLRIIPTEFSWTVDWMSLFDKWKTEMLMVKPQVGANANNTHKIKRENSPAKPLFSQDPLIQPFRQNILSEGEFSFHFFYGEFSHAIQKIPKQGDYRVQEEHGGKIISIMPSPADLKFATDIYKKVEAQLKEPSLFHRVDLVRNQQGELEIMELELVEPSLYFRMDRKASVNFVNSIKRMLLKKMG